MPEPGEIERRGRLLASAFGRMGTTALVPGERDLALGLPLLRKLAKQGGIPLLAANLYGRDGKRLFDADKIVDAAGTKIGLFGVSAPPTPDDAAAFKAAGIDARDPAAAARDGGRRPARARREDCGGAGARRRREREQASCSPRCPASTGRCSGTAG